MHMLIFLGFKKFVLGLEDEDNEEGATKIGKSKRNAWMFSPSLSMALMIVERMVVQNIWTDEQLLYRNILPKAADISSPKMDGLDILDDFSRTGFGFRSPGSEASPTFSQKYTEDFGTQNSKLDRDEEGEDPSDQQREQQQQDEDSPTMQVLWRYGTKAVKDRNVSCLAWNKSNSDILAVGYGDHGTNQSSLLQAGYICCWSLKNPVFPERVFKMDHAGVSSVDFSYNHPSLLAAGHNDGTLALFDIRKQGNTPVLRSTVLGGQHTGTVWQVKWVEKGKDRGESLVSISADGRVTEWSINKGLECKNLIKLKRIPNKQQGQSQVKGEALLSRQSGGMSMDFNALERFIYVVGTEDGTIHKCSTSYSEQYMETYAGHAGPVYKTRWSPFCADIFLTCSADWTAKMWRQDKIEPLLTFQSLPDAVHDVCWSPTISTMFASVTATGRIDVWDLVNPLEPKILMQLEGRSLNCVSFANQDSAVLVVGDNRGDVAVIKLSGNDFLAPKDADADPAAQEERLLKYLKKNTQ